jgi:predicted PurR-regulated permease PerM
LACVATTGFVVTGNVFQQLKTLLQQLENILQQLENLLQQLENGLQQQPDKVDGVATMS